jgi:hypothetical protein
LFKIRLDPRLGIERQRVRRLARFGRGLMRVAVRRQHLPDLPNARFTVRTSLTALLDLPQRTGATPDLFGDAAVGDTLANADEHGGLAALALI